MLLFICSEVVLPLRHAAWKASKYGVFFWSVFSFIRTEYWEILRISPYSVRMLGKKGPEKTPYLDTSRIDTQTYYGHGEHILMEFFLKIVNSFEWFTFCLKGSITDILEGSEYAFETNIFKVRNRNSELIRWILTF